MLQPGASDAVRIRLAASAEEVQGALRVREEVFCGEQGVSPADEVDGLDPQALHLLALAGGEERVVGTLRLLFAGGDARIGRVAVKRAWRRQGIAARMLELAVALARENGCRRARLAAQVDATRLYQRAGFEVQSEVFRQAGIEHVWMGRPLDPPAI